jgi:hypothetical protein
MPSLQSGPLIKGVDTSHTVSVDVRETINVRDRVGAVSWTSEVVSILEACIEDGVQTLRFVHITCGISVRRHS